MNLSNIVFYLGGSFLALAIFKVFAGIEIEPVFIFSYSMSALFFVLHDFWELMNRSVLAIRDKNIKRSLFHSRVFRFFKSKKSSEFLTYLAVLSIIFLPHVPFFKNMPINEMGVWSDCSTLLALAFTIMLISFKQSKAETEVVAKHLIEIESDNNEQDKRNTSPL